MSVSASSEDQKQKITKEVDKDFREGRSRVDAAFTVPLALA